MKLLYFAWVRQKIGSSEEDITAPSSVTTVAALVEFLRKRGAGYEAAFRDVKLLRVAVNQDYVGREHPLREGDEVAIFPPVTGG